MKNILLKHLLFTRRSSPNTSQSGFSLIELMVITVIIGVLSTIAAAGWEGFTSRQRIRTVNDQVFQALRSAQSDAKLKKETRELLFLVDENNLPKQVKIYQREAPDLSAIGGNQAVQTIDLTNNGSLKQGQLKVNFTSNGTAMTPLGPAALDTEGKEIVKGFKGIRFDYLGALPSDTTLPIEITTSTVEGKGKRCIIVETLLGGMRSAQGDECPP
jgi:prepilin-type N-terminal cleavage/methylation domain-containing protein